MRVGVYGKRTNRGWLSLHKPGLRLIGQLLEDKAIKPVDVTVLLALIEFQTRRSGLVQATCKEISQQPGMPCEDVVQLSLRRMESAGIIRRVGKRRSRLACLAVSPEIATSAKWTEKSWHLQAWHQLEAEAVPPPPPTASVIAAGIA